MWCLSGYTSGVDLPQDVSHRMLNALRLTPITNTTELIPSLVTHFLRLRWLATACCSCTRTHHGQLLLRGTNWLLKVSQLVPAGLTVAARCEILFNIARNEMQDAKKPQSNLRKGLTNTKSNEMHHVNGQNTLDKLFP